MTSPLVVGVPSWYRVKSTITSRRFAGHSLNESRLSGSGRRPPSAVIWVNCELVLAVIPQGNYFA